MTRKRIGAGLLEVFSEPCDHCNGRGVVIHTDHQVNAKSSGDSDKPLGKKTKAKKGKAGRDAQKLDENSDEFGNDTESDADFDSISRFGADAVPETTFVSSAPPPIESLGF